MVNDISLPVQPGASLLKIYIKNHPFVILEKDPWQKWNLETVLERDSGIQHNLNERVTSQNLQSCYKSMSEVKIGLPNCEDSLLYLASDICKEQAS